MMFHFKKSILYSVILFSLSLLFIIAFSTSFTCASTISIEQHVFDYAGILTQNEINKLEENFKKNSDAADISIIFITTYETNGKAASDYLEDFYDKGYKSNTIAKDATLLLVNMETHDIMIQGYGTCKVYIDDERIEYLLDGIAPELNNENYYSAALFFATNTQNYMGLEKKKPFFLKTWFLLLVSIFIGACSVGVMAYNSGGKVTTFSNTYLSGTSKGLIDHHDQFLHTTIRKVKREQQNSGSGENRSSDGHSHSEGSRKF